jgi:hypothetical protein
MGDSETVYISLCGLFLVLVVLIVVYTRIGTQSRKFCQKPPTAAKDSASEFSCEINKEKEEYSCHLMHQMNSVDTVIPSTESWFKYADDGKSFKHHIKFSDSKKIITEFSKYTKGKGHKMENKGFGELHWVSTTKGNVPNMSEYSGLACKEINPEDADELCTMGLGSWELSTAKTITDTKNFKKPDCDIFRNATRDKNIKSLLCVGAINVNGCAKKYSRLTLLPYKGMPLYRSMSWLGDKFHFSMQCEPKK